MAGREITCKYANSRALVYEYVRASMQTYTNAMTIASLVAFAFAGVAITGRASGIMIGILLLLGSLLLLDGRWWAIQRAAKKTIREYVRRYGTENVTVEIRISDVIVYRIKDSSVSYNYADITKISTTKNFVLFMFRNGVVPFLRSSLSESQLQDLKLMVNKKIRQNRK